MSNLQSLRQPKYLFLVITAGAVVLFTFFLTYKLNRVKAVNTQLNGVLDDTLKEKEQLQANITGLEQKLQEKERQLAELSNVAALRSSLQSAEASVKRLSDDMERVNAEKIAAVNEKFTLSNKLENSTKELLRTFDELKRTKDELQKTQGGGVNKELQLRNQELATVKEQLNKLQSANKDLSDSNVVLQKKIAELGSVVERSASQDLSPRVQALQAGASGIQAKLAEREARIKELESELSGLSAGEKGSYDAGQRDKLKEMAQANDDLKVKLADLGAELKKAKSASGTAVSRELYASSKDQLNRISSLLVKKDMEIDSVRKESLDAKEKLFDLQTKLSALESSASQNREMGGQLLALQGKLRDLQESASQKAELAESLQKNISYLTDQLALKDDQLTQAQSRYSKVDSAAREDLEKQKSRYDEMSQLYSSLKTQVSQFSDALNLKEAELEQRRKETSAFREEIAALRSRSESLEKDMADAKDRQRKTMDDLVAAVKLNTVLQEKVMGISPAAARGAAEAASSGAQQKADELKRKIQVILEPDKTP